MGKPTHMTAIGPPIVAGGREAWAIREALEIVAGALDAHELACAACRASRPCVGGRTLGEAFVGLRASGERLARPRISHSEWAIRGVA